MDDETIHVVAHYNSKTDQVYVNVFDDAETADEWSAARGEERDIEALLHKVVDLPEGFADDTVEQWEEHQ